MESKDESDVVIGEGPPAYEPIQANPPILSSTTLPEVESRSTETLQSSPVPRPVSPPPLVGIANPVYNPYPTEPPPAYGPQTVNFQAHHVHHGPGGTLSAAAGTHQAIMMNGRSSVAVVCPFCCNSVLTVTSEAPNPAFRANKRSAYYSLAGAIAFILILSGILIVMTDSTIALSVLPVIIIFLVLSSFFATRQRRRAATELFSDVTHTCPLCNKTLGVSSGFQFLQMTQSNQRRY